MLTPEHSVVAITYSSVDAILEGIRRLKTPSLVAVVSVSAYFLETARSLLAPAVGRRHSMQGYLMVRNRCERIGAVDVLICDAITYPIVRPRFKASTVFLYRLISTACLDKISSMITNRSSRSASVPPHTQHTTHNTHQCCVFVCCSDISDMGKCATHQMRFVGVCSACDI